MILFDFGVKLPSGFLSDVGRTMPFWSRKKVEDFLDDVYLIKASGLKLIRSHRTGNKVREDVDQIIRKFGYESTHRPGHQIGLNVHEPYGQHLDMGEENTSQLQRTAK